MTVDSHFRILLLVLALALCSGCAAIFAELQDIAAAPDAATPADGLREALRVGTGRAVELLARADGYLGDADVKIPIPDKLESVSRSLRRLGMDRPVDRFVESMNRAAEAAAPQAREVFVRLIREMTFADAVEILRGDDHEATDYLRHHGGPQLAELFQPIVEGKLAEVGATRSFDELMGRVEALPLVKRPAFDLTDYVTSQALDGLFLMIAREEVRIRRDPLARTTELLRRFFGEGA